MSIHPEAYKTLKRKLLQDEDISLALTYFFDNFGEDPEFFDHSKACKNMLLESVIQHIGGRLVAAKRPVSLQRLSMLNIPGQQFYHGSCTIKGQQVAFIYFDDIKTGCLGMVSSLSDPMQFVRFSAHVAIAPGQMPEV